MRKSILLVVFLFGLGSILVACGGDTNTQGDENGTEETEGAEDGTNDEEAAKDGEENDDQSIEVDKGLLNVEITLPATLFEGQDVDQVIAEAKEDGVSEVTKNDDGSLTYTMSKSVHSEMMDAMRDGLLNYIEEAVNNEEFASIKDITYNNALSEFTLVVDQEAFENSFDGLAVFGLGVSAMYYQLFNGVDPDHYEVTIHYENVDTGEVFNTVVYPDALDE